MNKQYVKRYTEDELFSCSAVEVYKLVLSGKLKRFPFGFWQHSEGKSNAIECIRFLFNDVLKLTDDEIKNLALYDLFLKYKLSTAIKICFDWKTFEAFNAAFPNRLKPWEIKCVPSYFWKDDKNIIEAVKWVLEEKLKLDDKQIKEIFTGSLLEENGLSGMIQSTDKTIFEILDMVYPNKFKPWDLKIIPNYFWDNNENKINAMKWLIEEKLKLSEDELKEQLSSNLFFSNNLTTLLDSFGGSPFKAIDTLYPNKYKPWEFKCVPNSFWANDYNRKSAIKWLIEEKLNLTDDEVKDKITQKVFRENGLGSLLSSYYKGSPYEAINEVYPNKYKPWEFSSAPSNFWKDDENIKETIKWLVEEKLNLSDKEIKERFGYRLLKHNNLDGLYISSRKSAFELFDMTYPNRFKAWEFKTVPKNYWDKKSNIIDATKWLVEKKSKDNTVKKINSISRKDFESNGLTTIVRKHSVSSLLSMAYPDKKFKIHK